MHILIIGGSGFLGKNLTQTLLAEGHMVTIKTRNKTSIENLDNNSITLIKRYDEMDNSPDCIISLAGSGIIDKRWTKSRQQELIDSRVQPLFEAYRWLEKNNLTVKKLLVGSAIGYYGYNPNPELELTESSFSYRDYTHEICAQLEESAEQLQDRFNNITQLRTGVVLGKNGGALEKMLMPAKFHLNGKIGNGKQWVSWIHINDWIKAVQYILFLESPRKVYNLTSPNPVTNAELSIAIGKALDKPLQLPVPALSLKVLMGKGSQLLLGSQKVLPEHLLAANFEFDYPNIEAACAQLIN